MINEVDISKFDHREKLAYLYGVSTTKALYEKFLDELLDELVNTDPVELLNHIDQLRETRVVKEQQVPSENKS